MRFGEYSSIIAWQLPLKTRLPRMLCSGDSPDRKGQAEIAGKFRENAGTLLKLGRRSAGPVRGGKRVKHLEVFGLLKLFERINTQILSVCRTIAIVALGLMVAVILLQVFFRYVLNNALPWPDEAARFLMLWMTGLMAPSAYRWGSFVSIDTIKDMLGRRAVLVLSLATLLLGLCVLLVALSFANKHITSGWLFNSSSLKIPLQLIGYKAVRIKLAWMYMSLPVGFTLMVLVSIELILKQLHMLFNSAIDYGPLPDQIKVSAE